MARFYFLILTFILTGQVSGQVTGDTSVCAGDIKLYSAPVVTGASYTWTVTGGNIVGPANINNITTQWPTAGAGTVIVSILNPNNTTTFYTLYAVVHPGPHPVIFHTPYATCPPAFNQGSIGHNQGTGPGCEKVCKYSTITYTTPLHAGSTYQWVVSGTLSATGTTTHTATVTWDSSGTGTIVVYETTLWGCRDSAALCIDKVNLPVAYFTHQATVCRFSTVLFNNLSTGATGYQWYFGDGGSSTVTNPSHSYSTAGTYTITLIAENACHCVDTFRSNITVDSLPGPTITCPATVCADDTAHYSTTGGTGCTYNWFVIGGTILSGQGTQSVTVQWGPGQLGSLGLVISGCGGVCSDTTWVSVPIVPLNATINGPTKVCPGDCDYYTLPRFSGATYHWSISGACGALTDSTCCEKVEICWPSYLIFCNDTLNVSYYDTFLHCGGSARLIIHLRPKLEILGNATVCANTLATLSTSNGVVSNWNVYPAGPVIIPGGPASGISIIWGGVPGTYTVTAIPANPLLACNDSAIFVIKVVAPPAAPVITGDTVVCANSSISYCTVTANTVHWIITGGTPSAAVGNCITVSWGAIPPFIVQAYQQMPGSPYCNSDTALQNVHLFIGGPPNIIAASPFCANSTNNFYTNTIYPVGTTYSWSIYPPNAGSALSPLSSSTQIQWGNNAPLTAAVTLIVNVCGTNYQNSVTINLQPAPTPSVIQIGSLCAGGTAQLQAVGGTYTAFNWSGPGAYASVVNPTTISQNGLYQVTVTDANGCTALSQHSVMYVSGPTASISTFDNLGYCIGATYSVTMCALGNANYQYLWSNTGNTQCINVASPNSYAVTVTDITNGCTAVSNILVVHEDSCHGGGGGPCIPGGSISFTHSGCNPVIFTNTSVSGSSYTWNFGDLNSSNLISPTHFYTQAGFYLVTLSGYVPNNTGTDSCLLTDTAHIEIPLAAKFDFLKGCNGTPVCFTDKSTHTAGNNITSWNWNFGDLGSSSSPNPCHTYSSPGSYAVTLTISNSTCTVSYIATVVIANPPTASFTFSNPNCVNSPVIFTDASFASVNYWHWTFNDGGSSLNQNPFHTYTLPGFYFDTLIVHDIYGCYDTVDHKVTIVSPSLSGSITAYPDTVVCQGTAVKLKAPFCGTCTYIWNTGATADSIFVTNTGIYSVTITDANGCPYTTFIHIIVNNGPPAVIQNSGSNHLCLGGSATLSVTYNIKWLYYWITNDGVNNGNTNNAIGVNPGVPGLYTYRVAITDTSTGCSDTSLVYIINVTGLPVPPTISALGPISVCQGDTITLVGTHPDSTVTFLWNTGDVIDTIQVTKNGCYQLQATDTNGCTSMSAYCVTVNPMPDLCSFYAGCYDTCRPYTIKGPAGGTTYQWLFNGNPIVVNGNAQNYVATLNGAYAVIVTNGYGCTDTTGKLNLNLYDCPDSLCADLIIDSTHCDSSGHYIMFYHVANNSQVTITQISLEILQPNLNIAYAPNVTFMNVPSATNSPQLVTTIYNAHHGDVLCFRTHISRYDSTGHEIICCYSDTQCVTMPSCTTDTANCCYFHFLHDSIRCEQTPLGTKYNFTLKINGCGSLTIQTPNAGVLNVSNPYTLVPGINTISGSYISSTDSVLCLTFLVSHNNVFCADTSICFGIKCNQHPLPCNWDYNTSVCAGHTGPFSYFGPIAGLTITWSFPGGIPSTITGPGPFNILYPTAGVYPFTMTLTNVNGSTTCTDSMHVIAAPVATVAQNGSTLYASPAGMYYQWYVGPPNWSAIPGQTNQFYTPGTSGNYCVQVSNNYGCYDTACIDYLAEGIELLGAGNWSIYPNPNDGSFTLRVDMIIAEPIEMKVMNAVGEVIDKRNFELKSGMQQFYISNQNFAAGIYYVQLKTNSEVSIRRMVVN